jgi:hypothetical protein
VAEWSFARIAAPLRSSASPCEASMTHDPKPPPVRFNFDAVYDESCITVARRQNVDVCHRHLHRVPWDSIA